MKTYLKSSPHFFRLVSRAFWLGITLLLLLALLLPAPLQEPSNLAVVPNPAKSAWFLLWIQELVSYRVWLIYPVLLASLLFCLLPWLANQTATAATWFGSSHRTIAWLAMLIFLLMVVLTVIGLFFRGENWALIWPF